MDEGAEVRTEGEGVKGRRATGSVARRCPRGMFWWGRKVSFDWSDTTA